MSLVSVLISFCIPIVHLSGHGVAQVEFFKMPEEKFNELIGSVVYNAIISFIAVTLLLVICGPSISKWIDLPYIWLLLVPFIALTQFIPQLLLSIFQVQKKALTYAKFNLSLAVANLSLGLLLVVGIGLNWQGRILSLLITYLIFSLIGLMILFKSSLISFKVNKNLNYSALSFGIPLIPHLIGSLVVELSDRVFISQMVGIHELGIYNVGYQIGMIISVLQHSFALAYTPTLFENLKLGDEASKLKIVRITYFFTLGLFLTLIILTILAPLIFKYLIDPDFKEGIRFVFWVGLGYAFLGMYKMVTGFIFYLKKTRILAYLSVFNVGLNLILNYFLILKYGSLGAAYATCISFFALFIIVAIISNRLYPMPWGRLGAIFTTRRWV